MQRDRFFKKSSLFLVLLLFFIGVGFYFLDTNFRGLASFSNDEIEYAEDFLLGEETPDYSEINVNPAWKDDLKRQHRNRDTIQQRLENELQAEYEKELLEYVKKRTGKERKKTNLEIQLEAQGQQFFEAATEALKE